eukprot:PhF_6_TR20350/c0_g1_i1/m.29329
MYVSLWLILDIFQSFLLPSVSSDSFSSNEFTLYSGTIPNDLPSDSKWQNITVFDISVFDVSGTIPSSLSAWTALVEFLVHTTEISGTIPSLLSTWTSVRNFDAHSTQISGTIPSSLSTWTFM